MIWNDKYAKMQMKKSVVNKKAVIDGARFAAPLLFTHCQR